MTGTELRRRRKRAKLTQQQLADRLGVARNSVVRWENGTLGMRPSTDKLIRLVLKGA